MTRASPKPCAHAGCPALVFDGAGWCQKHIRPKPGSFSDPSRGTRQQRGYGAEWEKLRKQILQRDKGLCQVCLQEGRYRPAKAVDHIKPKSQGGTDDHDNLQAICVECHRTKTAREAVAGGGRKPRHPAA